MKKTVLYFFTVFQIVNLNAQQNPVGNPPANNTIIQANSSWYRGGNNLGTIPNNIFGTLWNSPIYTQTNGRNRMKLNGTTTYTVNGIASPNSKEGYLLIGLEPLGPPLLNLFQTNQFGNNAGAFSQLHITGLRATSQGYRPWMHTGITFTDNDDLSYFGTRKLGAVNTTNQNETVICWSNDRSNAWGFDDMSFRFANEANPNPSGPATLYNNTINNTDFNTANDLDGRHVARFSGTGELGLGNTFGVNISLPPNSTWLNTIYVRPKSLAHLSTSVLDSVWLQFTNRHTAINTGTGENATDGLRIGIIGADTSNAATLLGNGTAAIYNQEKRPILMSTDARTSTVAPMTGNTSERVRVTSVSTPTNLPSPANGMGLFNPGVFTPSSADTNITRVSISHNPAFPVTRPLSLLHLGYNSTTTSATTTDGWRPWMDVGMFTSNQSDHVYLGLKNESLDTVNNKQDAVLGWGDDPSDTLGNGADNLRFIFTAASTNNISPANTANGLEVGRMVPTIASTLSAPNFGMMGIGDFSPSSPNNGVTGGVINNVDAKLDIDGDLRIRTVTRRDSLMRVLVIDTLDHNRVHYRDIPLGSGSGQGFFQCADTTGAANLISDSKINLNDNNLYFEKNGILGENHVGIGYNCAVNLRAKLSVQQTHPQNVNQSTIAVSGLNRDVSTVLNRTFTGVEGLAIGVQTQQKVINRGGYFAARNALDTRGIVVEIPASPNNTESAIGGDFILSTTANQNIGINVACTGNGSGLNNTSVGISTLAANSSLENTGGRFIGSSVNLNAGATGVSGVARGSNTRNIGGGFTAFVNTSLVNNSGVNIGVSGRVAAPINFYTYPTSTAIGVYGFSYNLNVPSYAGFFDGRVWVNGPVTATGFTSTTSDQNFKSDIHLISNADAILSQLQPKTFYFDTLNPYGFNFSNRLQYGLLAQEVETVLPELVSNEYKPATVDSTGAVVTQGVDYKALNYDAFISILISGHKEQKQQIDSLQNGIDNRDSLINNLNDRLTQLESCLSVILPLLCHISNSAIQPTQEEFQEQLKNEINVQLSNKNSIILNQNVPNPFAEQTQISFSIPETVKKAQIHFYDANGKLINSVEVQERGLGQLNVFANDLSTGVYTYTLVADGQIVATKKMMKQ